MAFFQRVLSRQKSILHKYVLHYLVIALLAIALVGVSLFIVSANALNATLAQAEREKLALVANDLDAQFDAIQSVAYSISSNVYYQPAYLGRSRFYEIALVKDFANYKSYSPVMADYFLLYEGEEDVFYPGGKTPFALYIERIAGGDAQALYAAITAVRATSSLEPLDGGDFLFICPLRFLSAQEGSQPAWFCAYVPRDTLMQRVDFVSGGFESRIALQYGQEEPLAPDALRAGAFTISLVPAEQAEYSDVLRFRQMCVWLSVGIAVLLVAVSLTLAYASYRPIRRVLAHHSAIQAHAQGNELAMLDDALTQAMRSHQLSERQLKSLLRQTNQQRRQLKDALLSGLVIGNGSDNVLRALQEAAIRLDGPWYVAIVLALDCEEEIPAENVIAFTEAIERLSGEDAQYYAIQMDREPMFAVLVSTGETNPAAQMPDVLQEIAEMELHRIPRVGYGYPVMNLSQLPASLASAMAQASAQGGNPSGAQQESQCNQLFQALRQGSCAAALAALDGINDALPRWYPSFLAQRCFYSDLLSRIVLLAREQGIALTQDCVNALGSMPVSDACQRELRLLIAELCEKATREVPEHADQRGAQIVGYIQEHLLDYNLSLETVAEVFGLSGKQIGRLIARETGLSYKELVIERRILRAKEMLLSGESVSSVCERLNYASLPYFIKLFREKTGFTPAKYRSMHAGNQEDA